MPAGQAEFGKALEDTAVGVAATGAKGNVVPEGMTTLSVPAGGPKVILELGLGLAELEDEAELVDLVVVGKARVVGIASCKRHLTSSAEQRSKGVWPS